MTRTCRIGASLVALSTISLAACVTPAYPTHASDSTAPEPVSSPASPVASQGQAPPAQSPPSQSSQAQASPQSSTPDIDTRPLPPVEPAPQAATPAPSPAQSALAPDYKPPAAQAEAPPPAAATQAPSSPSELRFHIPPERVVAAGRVVAAHGMYRDYVVQPKDHVDAIARDLQTTRKELVDANHLKAPYALRPGQHLKVPVAKAYEVQSGDTMTEVARRFSVSVGDLSDLNDLPVKARLHPGDLLALPEGFHDRGPTRLAAAEGAEHAPEPRITPRTRVLAAPRPSSGIVADGGAYVPSPAALAAAQRLAASHANPPPAYTPPNPTTSTESTQAAEAPTNAQLAAASAGRGRFIWPVRGEIISPFGVKGLGRRNDGIDVRSAEGTTVRAAAAGDVVYAGDQVPGFGNLVLVKHADGWVTAYAHLQSIGVQMRQAVVQGQTLGQVGSTGGVAEPQLHFEIRYAANPAEKARPVDPQLVLPK